jgi:mannose-1-phosphate guanylyltransferase
MPGTADHPPYALVMAGGSGTRFWPLSRAGRPKQLLDLFGDGTLLEHALARLGGLVPQENILVLTSAAQAAAVRALLPWLPPENVVAEPERRDTAPAVAFAAGWVAARDPSAVMLVLPADQRISDTSGFQRVMRGALELAARSGALVTVGITPTWPCPGYGYVERGSAVDTSGQQAPVAAFEVARFREKPDRATAEGYLAAGNFAWNAGIFAWSVPALLAQLSRHCPELAAFAAEVAGSPDALATLAARFPALTPISIDFALMERADRVLNVEAEFDWDDVGSWVSVGKYLPTDAAGNAVHGAVTAIESAANIVYAGPGVEVALLGVEGLVVVQTPDGILVADRSRADEIKKVVDRLPARVR